MVWIIVIAALFAATGIACGVISKSIDNTHPAEPAPVEDIMEKEEPRRSYYSPVLAQLEREAHEVQEKRKAEVEQAKDDRAFLLNQLKRFDTLIAETNANLYKAQKSVDLDVWMDEHGTPVAEKVSNKHITERDRLVKLVIRYETQIHAAEKKLAKVEAIISRG